MDVASLTSKVGQMHHHRFPYLHVRPVVNEDSTAEKSEMSASRVPGQGYNSTFGERSLPGPAFHGVDEIRKDIARVIEGIEVGRSVPRRKKGV